MRTKQLIFLLVSLLFFNSIKAQQDTLEIEPRDFADSVYGQLSASNIPSGRLFNRMFIAHDESISEHFNANTTDTANADFFYGTLNELRSMSFDSSSFIYPNTIYLEAQNTYGKYEFDEEKIVIPIGIIDYTYQSMDETTGFVQLTNLQFFDDGINSAAAFSTKRVQMIAPMFDFVSDDVMYFIIKEDWILTDNEEAIQTLEINTGNGWIALNFDELITYYPQNSEKQFFNIRLVYENGDTIQSTISIRTPEMITPKEKSDFACNLDGDLSDNSGNTLKWCLLYGCQEGTNPYILDKPYILVTGYRPPIILQTFKKTYKIYDGHQNSYLKLLKSRGFDVFLVRFNMYNNIHQSMEDEGDLLARFINEYVNLNKSDHYENIVQGCSMGSDVITYALTKMEHEHLYNNGPNPHTREFIAFDADFYGANLPLSFQYMIYSKMYNPIGTGGIGVANQFLGFFLFNVMEQKVVKELLAYHALGNNGNVKPFPYSSFSQHDIVPTAHPYRDGFLYNLSLYNSYDKFIPLPNSTRNVSVSLGKISTTNDVNPASGVYFKQAGEFFVNLNFWLEKYYLKAALYSSSDFFKIFERKNSLLFIGLPILFCHQRMSVKYMQNIDNASGSYLDGFGNIVEVAEGAYGLPDIGVQHHEFFSHKPVVSALAINRNLWPANGSMTLNIQDLGLMYISHENFNQDIKSNFYGYPNVGRPSDHFDITPFEAIYVDNEIDPHIDLGNSNSNYKDSLNKFLLEEVDPWVLGLQNWQLGGHARSNYEYIAKRVAHIINLGTDVTPVTDKGAYTIEPNGHLILEACDVINFENGFSTDWGAKMEADIKFNPCICGRYNTNLGVNSNNSGKSQKDLLANKTSISASTSTIPVSVQNKKDDIKVYPNPTKGVFSIALQENEIIQAVEIYEMNGRLVYEQQSLSEKRELTIEKQFPKGSYLIRVQSKNKVYNTKLVVL